MRRVEKSGNDGKRLCRGRPGEPNFSYVIYAGEVGSVTGQASAGTAPSASHPLGSTDLSTNSLVGGELPGGVKMKLGDKVIDLRGNVGVGDNGGNFKAGVGLPF